jgi:hypothetical protein
MTRWLFGLAAAAAFAAPACAQDDVKKVIDKAVTAHGGADALKKYKAAKATIKGDLSAAGMEMTFEGTMASEYPGKFKVVIDASIMGQKLSILQVANGDKTKSRVSLAGMDLPSGGDDEKDELKASAALQDMSQIYPLLDDKKYALKAEADAEVDGKKVAVIGVTVLDSKKTVALSFDKESGLLVKTQRKGRGPAADGSVKEVDEESFMSDYKKVNGLMTPMKMLVKHDGTKFMSYTLSDVENLESLPAGTFATDD